MTWRLNGSRDIRTKGRCCIYEIFYLANFLLSFKVISTYSDLKIFRVITELYKPQMIEKENFTPNNIIQNNKLQHETTYVKCQDKTSDRKYLISG